MDYNSAIEGWKAFSKGIRADFGRVSKSEAQTGAAMFTILHESIPFSLQDNFAREVQGQDPALFDMIKFYKGNTHDNSGPAVPYNE